MSRVVKASRAVPGEESRSGNLAIRIHPSLMSDLEAKIAGRKCNKSEFITQMLRAVLGSDLASQVIDEVEASKVRTLQVLSRDEIMRRLQSAESERQILVAALASMDAAKKT